MKRAFFCSRFLLQYIAAALAILRRVESVSPAEQIFFVKMRAVPTALVHVLPPSASSAELCIFTWNRMALLSLRPCLQTVFAVHIEKHSVAGALSIIPLFPYAKCRKSSHLILQITRLPQRSRSSCSGLQTIPSMGMSPSVLCGCPFTNATASSSVPFPTTGTVVRPNAAAQCSTDSLG